ncbi:MAG: aminoglycoside phosphotransferase family protein [Legionella sp.]|nr:aminoglycoside phosphotransferase family protein [Legionella sp.]
MDELNSYLKQWSLTPDGECISTNTSILLPVRYQHKPALLKIATSTEEQTGGELMLWWSSEGAAPVLAHGHNALLMERALGASSLINKVRLNQDDEATRIICAVVNRLHKVRKNPLPSQLVPLASWFNALEPAAIRHGGVLQQALLVATELLNSMQDQVVLHGDIHHGNILDFGANGWLAIDPKGLLGERGFDFANIFCNPDFHAATKSGRLERQAAIVAHATGIEATRLIQWILAYAGLSAAWHFEDGTNPETALAVASIAWSLLNA